MKVLITRPCAQANDFAENLRTAGFEPVFFPVIEIKEVENNVELQNAISNIQKYAWVVFTSVNAAEIVLNGSAPAVFAGVKIAAVGPKTAAALRKYNFKPDFIPDEYIGAAIMSGLGDVKDEWILLPRAELAREELPKAIIKAGGVAHEIIVYQTLPAEIDLNGLAALKSGVDVVTFTSGSAVENFIELARQNHLNPLNLPNTPLFACIGPVTAETARAAGLPNLIIAEEYTTDGLIRKILEHFNLEKNYGTA